MDKPYCTIKMDHGIVIKIYQDDNADNPIQDFDGQAHVSVWHRRYDFGNNHDFKTSTDFEEHFQEQNRPRHLAKNPEDRIYRLPVYLYDHSGLTVSTEPFSCPWDSGQVGWVWTTKKEAADVMGPTTPTEDEIEVYLRSTVRLLNHYLTGNVWGYVIEDAEGNLLDSCWGFYGDRDEHVIPEAKSAAEYHVKRLADERLERARRRDKCFAI